MGKAYSTHLGDEKYIHYSRTLKGRDHIGDLSVNGRMILKYILRNRE
jgi:hypothetical protein